MLNDESITVAEACQKLNLPRWTVYQWVRTGRLQKVLGEGNKPGVRGAGMHISRASVENALHERSLSIKQPSTRLERPSLEDGPGG